MSHAKTFLALTLASAVAAPAAMAQSWSNSGAYNGYGAATQNTPANYSLRDTNGNLTLVNGQFQPSIYSSQTGSQYASSSAGVGMSGAGTAYGQATAIGNSLNVVVVGTHNTTVIDTTQINNGNQTATAALNGH
jgi:holdfast attachment protein HfaA